MRTLADQIAAIRADQRFWRTLAAEVGPDRYAEPGPMGDWSFGDLAGHLLGWRERTLARLGAFGAGEPEPPNPWPADVDTGDPSDDPINAWIYANHADRSPAQLVAAYDASYDRLVAVLEAIPEDRLTDPEGRDWFGGTLVEVDFTGHLHDEHVPSVRAWLET